MWNTIANAGFGYLKAARDAKASRAWDKYNNAVAGMQGGQALNSITVNESMNREQHAKNKVAIEVSRLMATAKVTAGAAAAGVSGGSVDATLFNVGRNAGNRQAQEADSFENGLMVTTQQRRNISLQRQLAQKPLTPMPSILGFVGNAMADILGEQVDEVGSSGTTLNGAQQTTGNGGWDWLKTTMLS